MKKLFIFFIVTFCISSFINNASCETILDDNTIVLNMMRAKVNAAAIKAARAEQTEETITALILAAAPHYPLEEIFKLYPVSGAPSSTTTAPSGEDAFFNKCQQDPFLYQKFFLALAGKYFTIGDDSPYNPFEDEKMFDIADDTISAHGSLNLKTKNVTQIKRILLPVQFSTIKGRIKEAPNFKVFVKLLDQRFPKLTFQRGKKTNLKKRELIRNIRIIVPFIRGEVAIKHNRDSALALACFEESQNEGATDMREELLKVKIAELKIGVFDGLLDLNTKVHDESGATHLFSSVSQNAPKNIAKLRLAQYHLGFFGHKINENKGLKLLEKISKERFISHLAYLTWAEYYLGITNPKAFDLDRAREFLERTMEESEGITAIQESVFIREGEIALGIYGEDAEEEVEIDVKQATKFFERDSTGCTENYLYNIYTGVYGEAYKDDQKAQQIIARNTSGNSSFLKLKKAVADYKDGKIDEAVEIFEKHPNEIRCAYLLGCIKSNPRYKKYYNPPQALAHFLKILSYGLFFRDSTARFLKVFMTGHNMKIKPDHVENGCRYLVRKMKKGIMDFPTDELEKAGFILPPEWKKNNTSEKDSSTDTPVESTAEPCDDNDNSTDSDDEINYTGLADALEAIDVEAPILTLKDQRLQTMYDNFGSTIRWQRLQKLVKAFDGVINMDAQTIKLPHCEIFNFHRPHSGNPMLSMKHYWAVLKRMVDKEYKIRCQEEAAENEQASASAAGPTSETTTTTSVYADENASA